MGKIFLSPDKSRLRAGWRLMAQLAVFQTFLAALGALWGIGRRLLKLGFPPGLAEAEALTALAMTGAVLIARKWLDKRSFASLGLQLDRRAGVELLAGFGIGAVIMALVFTILLSAGWASITSNLLQTGGAAQAGMALALGVGVFLLAGWQEELYFRGYLLQNLKDGSNLSTAVLVSSFFFGLAHLTNPNSLAVGAIGTALAGLLMAYGCLRTGRLWLSIGLHTGWNLFEGVVFGLPVSGLATPRLLSVQVSGPVMLTGGAFGPEAGLALIPALLLGALLIRLYPSHKTSG